MTARRTIVGRVVRVARAMPSAGGVVIARAEGRGFNVDRIAFMHPTCRPRAAERAALEASR